MNNIEEIRKKYQEVLNLLDGSTKPPITPLSQKGEPTLIPKRKHRETQIVKISEIML